MEIIKPRPLTHKQKLWIAKVVETSDPNRATMEVFNNTTPGSRYLQTNRMMKNVDVQAVLAEVMAEQGITPSWIVGKHKELINNSENDMVKTKNLEDLGEMSGLYPKSGGTKVDVNREGIRVSWGGDE